MDEHAANGFNLKPEMLDDMKHNDDETDIIIQKFEDNLAKRLSVPGAIPYEAVRWAIWDTHKWEIILPSIFQYITEFLAIS